MKRFYQGVLFTAVAATLPTQSLFAADSLSEALKSSTVSGNFNLRYEDVERGTVDSDGLTLRSRLMMKSAGYKGFTALVEVEDVRDVFGIDDENNLIPDPEVTELDQAFIQYKGSSYTAKLGRQVIALDGQRFIGHVGWRQDRQTYDAFRTSFKPSKNLALDLSYIYKRNRIFGESLDAKSNDILLNAAYKTSIGKVVAYGYLLDDETRDEQSDTFGVSLKGSTGSDVKFLYHAQYATQSIEDGGADFDTDYTFIEGGVSISGITVKLGYEVLSSDDGLASFTTPLATLHKFNGWADVFLGGAFNPIALPNGIEDTYLSLGTKISGIKVAMAFHEYSANEGSADYGDELNFVATKAFKGGTSLQLKYASYSADDFAADTDKLWISAGYKF